MAKIAGVDSRIGKSDRERQIVCNGTCPYCECKVSFRQMYFSRYSEVLEDEIVGLQCEHCDGVVCCSLTDYEIHPSPKISGIKDIPDDVQKYYQEALRCLSVNAPNGAATLFRKTIHAIGIHYGLAVKNDARKIHEIIEEIFKQGHISSKLKDALIGVRDIGNDGAHVNENEPDMEQAMALKQIVDAVLNATVVNDQSLALLRQKHPAK